MQWQPWNDNNHKYGTLTCLHGNLQTGTKQVLGGGASLVTRLHNGCPAVQNGHHQSCGSIVVDPLSCASKLLSVVHLRFDSYLMCWCKTFAVVVFVSACIMSPHDASEYSCCIMNTFDAWCAFMMHQDCPQMIIHDKVLLLLDILNYLFPIWISNHSLFIWGSLFWTHIILIPSVRRREVPRWGSGTRLPELAGSGDLGMSSKKLSF